MNRVASLTQEIAQAMRLSFNGVPAHVVAERLERDELALVRADSPDGVAYAVVSQTGNIACIEALQGRGGTLLAAIIAERARRAGMQCEGWVFNKARARLFARAGFIPTGQERPSGTGTQLRVLSP